MAAKPPVAPAIPKAPDGFTLRLWVNPKLEKDAVTGLYKDQDLLIMGDMKLREVSRSVPKEGKIDLQVLIDQMKGELLRIVG